MRHSGDPSSQDPPDPSALRHRGKLSTQSMVPRARMMYHPSATSSVELMGANGNDGDLDAASTLTKKAKDSNVQLRDLDAGRSNFALDISGSEPEDLSTQITLDIGARTVDSERNDHRLNSASESDDDRAGLLSHSNDRLPRRFLPESALQENEETSCAIALQISFPFLIAGMGMVAAGLVLDKVQHWEVFENVSEVFILVPALLGLKGNLEMTLASRLSTVAHLGYLDDPKKKWTIIGGNMILVEAQAMVVAFLASFVAMVLGWIPDGKWETNHALILCAGSLLTGVIASGILGAIMIFVIILSRKCGINPDNVATPIAASLGDLTTLSLLSGIAKGLYNILQDPNRVWIVWSIIFFFVILTPIFVYFSYRNEHTRDIIKNGWFPILAAMGISSVGGFILDFAVSSNPGVAVFAPVINGVGGNFVAVQASRLSTHLHRSKHPLGTLPPSKSCDCTTPCFLYCGKENVHARSARVMTMMAIPGQLVFLLTIQFLEAGHTTISPQFVVVYLIVSLIQVTVLLFVCHWLVYRLWRNGDDPDNGAIPYLTALGDFLGTGLLALGFLFLWAVGDRDQDVGD